MTADPRRVGAVRQPPAGPPGDPRSAASRLKSLVMSNSRHLTAHGQPVCEQVPPEAARVTSLGLAKLWRQRMRRSLRNGSGSHAWALRQSARTASASPSPAPRPAGGSFNRGRTPRRASPPLYGAPGARMPRSRPTQRPSGQRPSHTVRATACRQMAGGAAAPCAPTRRPKRPGEAPVKRPQ